MREHPYRVVQWATGVLGRSVIRGIAERDDLELTGVRVYDRAKAGKDAGELVAGKPMNVFATADPAEIMTLKADCVIYAPLPSAIFDDTAPGRDLDTICDLLTAGKNVISMTGLVYPYALGPGTVERLRTACRAGGTSVHGTGVSPGFLSDVLPLTLSGLTRRVSHVYVRECSDFAGHPSRRLVRGVAGLGVPGEDYQRELRPLRSLMLSYYAESIHLLADGLGISIDQVESQHEVALATEDFEIAAGPIPAGAVSGSRWIFTGLAGGRPVITIEAVHKADARRLERWSEPGCSLRIEGRPSIELTAGTEWISNGVSAAAAHAINSIGPVCEAEPGIRTALDLPLVRSRAVTAGTGCPR
jgi:2,4-diaminopentanoate dehydrogenase